MQRQYYSFWDGALAVSLSVLVHVAVLVFALYPRGAHQEITPPPPPLAVALYERHERPAKPQARPKQGIKKDKGSASRSKPIIKTPDPLPVTQDTPSLESLVDLTSIKELSKKLDKQKAKSDTPTAQVSNRAPVSKNSEQQALDRYASLLADQVYPLWRRPPNARADMEVLLTLWLDMNGKITVQIAQSSGDTDFDHSAIEAIRRLGVFSSVATMPRDLFNQYFRRLNLKFRPDDLAFR